MAEYGGLHAGVGGSFTKISGSLQWHCVSKSESVQRHGAKPAQVLLRGVHLGVAPSGLEDTDTIKAKGKWKKQHAHALQARQQQGLLDVVQMVTTQPGQQPPPPEQEDQQQAPADEHAADMDMHTGGGGGSEFIVSSSAASCPAVACNNDSNSPTPGGFGLGMDLDYIRIRHQ